MGLITNEQEVKRQTQFLKYESGDNGNQLMLKSNLYKIDSHFIQSERVSVACRGEECMYCQAGYQKRPEFNYFVYLNGETGYIDIKPSVFYQIQAIARAQKRDVREISWTVIKKGEGLKTDYTVSKDDNLAEEDYELVKENLEENTQKLVDIMGRREEKLDEEYVAHMKDIRKQTVAKPKKTEKPEEGVVVDPEEDDDEPEVKPDEIPF